MIDNVKLKGSFWEYLSQNQKDLFIEGQYIKEEIIRDCKYCFKDYSFLVFPYAKGFEGFLKQLFYDVGFLPRLDYISDHLRLGKLLSPQLVDKLDGDSLYKKIKNATTKELADQAWNAWREGRNQVFHYFPHNTKAITFREAEMKIENILDTMEKLYLNLYYLYQKDTEDTSEQPPQVG